MLGRQHLQLLISAVCGPGGGGTGSGRESELLWFIEAQSPQAVVSRVTSVLPWPLQRVVSVSQLSLIDDSVLQAPRKSPSSSRGPLLRQPGVWPLAQSHRHNHFSCSVALARCCHAPACHLPAACLSQPSTTLCTLVLVALPLAVLPSPSLGLHSLVWRLWFCPLVLSLLPFHRPVSCISFTDSHFSPHPPGSPGMEFQKPSFLEGVPMGVSLKQPPGGKPGSHAQKSC